MQKQALINRIRSLSNIDGYRLPQLTAQEQAEFLRDPVRYFLNAEERQSDAIMREIERRQPAEPKRKPKGKTMATEGQREMLLPIAGGKTAVQNKRAQPTRRKIG